MKKEIRLGLLTIAMTLAGCSNEQTGLPTPNKPTLLRDGGKTSGNDIEKIYQEFKTPKITDYETNITGEIDHGNFSILVMQSHTNTQTSIFIKIINNDTTGEIIEENIWITQFSTTENESRTVKYHTIKNFQGNIDNTSEPVLIKNDQVQSAIDKMIKKAEGKLNPLKIVLGRN